TFSVRATDSQNLVTQATYTIVIAAAAPVITTTTLPAGTAGQAYSQSISASGGTPPYTFSQISGNLPPSLTFSPSGILSGNANTPGTFTFTVRVNDSANQSTDATFTIEIASGATPLAISALAPPPGLLYFPYNFSLSASGGRQPYNWSIPLGPIPNGLRLDANGVLNGLLLAPGSYRFTVRVSDANGATADSSLAITVAGSTRLAQGRVGSPYSAQAPPPIAGRPPYTYTVNANALGDLPVGLSLAADGTISGTPSASGDFTFGILIRDASGFGSNASITVPVVPAAGLSIVTPSLPGGATGTAYSQTLAASGGRPPYTWAISSGTVPNGLNLNPLSGQISGTPTIQGTGFFVVRVSDSAGSTATSYFGISVGAPGSPVLNAITSAASYGANGIVPGELIVLFGSPLGPQTLTSFSLVNNEVPTQLGGTRVLFDGVAAPLIYTLTGQVSAIAPFNLEGRPSTRIVVEYLGFQSTPYLMPVLASKPGLFTVDGSGQGPGALLNQNGSVNTQSNRAARESVIVLYATGAGAMTPAGQAGRVAGGTSSLNQQTLVTINGAPATVLYSGNAPGLVEGVVQINVKLPLNTVPGQNSISVQIGAAATTSNVTVWVE
ncbi:MAG: putative Ig domain-containing protein, partial [Acidobacteria bacterium]|nr:putative Ig domain-containing protein [Acidobacteriota bacterium]